jgi:hypothetical protein
MNGPGKTRIVNGRYQLDPVVYSSASKTASTIAVRKFETLLGRILCVEKAMEVDRDAGDVRGQTGKQKVHRL